MRAVLAEFVGALEGDGEPDAVLNEMEEMAGHIRSGVAAV